MPATRIRVRVPSVVTTTYSALIVLNKAAPVATETAIQAQMAIHGDTVILYSQNDLVDASKAWKVVVVAPTCAAATVPTGWAAYPMLVLGLVSYAGRVGCVIAGGTATNEASSSVKAVDTFTSVVGLFRMRHGATLIAANDGTASALQSTATTNLIPGSLGYLQAPSGKVVGIRVEKGAQLQAGNASLLSVAPERLVYVGLQTAAWTTTTGLGIWGKEMIDAPLRWLRRATTTFVRPAAPIGSYAIPGAPSDRYVDSVNGNDTWDGTTAVHSATPPGNTIGPWKTAAKAAASASSGATVMGRTGASPIREQVNTSKILTWQPLIGEQFSWLGCVDHKNDDSGGGPGSAWSNPAPGQWSIPFDPRDYPTLTPEDLSGPYSNVDNAALWIRTIAFGSTTQGSTAVTATGLTAVGAGAVASDVGKPVALTDSRGHSLVGASGLTVAAGSAGDAIVLSTAVIGFKVTDAQTQIGGNANKLTSTQAAWSAADVGSTVTCPNVPGGTTILSVAGTIATMSASATAAASNLTATIGSGTTSATTKVAISEYHLGAYINGEPLLMRTAANQIDEKTFYFDRVNCVLYIGKNPTTCATVEITHFDYCLKMTGVGAKAQGILFGSAHSHANTDGSAGALVSSGNNQTVENDIFHGSTGIGVTLYNPGLATGNLLVIANGCKGYNYNNTDSHQPSGYHRCYFNNRHRYSNSTGAAAGLAGSKVTNTQTIQNGASFEAIGDYGMNGGWYDLSDTGAVSKYRASWCGGGPQTAGNGVWLEDGGPMDFGDFAIDHCTGVGLRIGEFGLARIVNGTIVNCSGAQVDIYAGASSGSSRHAETVKLMNLVMAVTSPYVAPTNAMLRVRTNRVPSTAGGEFASTMFPTGIDRIAFIRSVAGVPTNVIQWLEDDGSSTNSNYVSLAEFHDGAGPKLAHAAALNDYAGSIDLVGVAGSTVFVNDDHGGGATEYPQPDLRAKVGGPLDNTGAPISDATLAALIGVATGASLDMGSLTVA